LKTAADAPCIIVWQFPTKATAMSKRKMMRMLKVGQKQQCQDANFKQTLFKQG